MTRCEELQLSLSAALDGDLSPEEAAALASHLAECAACTAEQEALRTVAEQVRALPRLAVPSYFPAMVMAGVTGETGAQAPAATAPADCRVTWAEALSADLDGDLAASEQEALAGHLAGCAACAREHEDLRRLTVQVRGLPRLTPPAELVARVMEQVDGLAREAEARRAADRASSLRWWGRIGTLARAAAVLLMVGGGMSLTRPERVVPGFAPSFPGAARSAPLAPPEMDALDAAEGAGAAARNEAPPLPEGPYDAVLTLEVDGRLEEAQPPVEELLSRLAPRREGSLAAERFLGYVVAVPGNLTDDLLRGLEALPQVSGGRDDSEAVEEIHTESDVLVLRGGFVFVGQVSQRGREVMLQAGETVLRFPRDQVLEIRQADRPRRVRLELRQRD